MTEPPVSYCPGHGPIVVCGKDVRKAESKDKSPWWCAECLARRLCFLACHPHLTKKNYADEPLFSKLWENTGLHVLDPRYQSFIHRKYRGALKHDFTNKLKNWGLVSHTKDQDGQLVSKWLRPNITDAWKDNAHGIDACIFWLTENGHREAPETTAPDTEAEDEVAPSQAREHIRVREIASHQIPPKDDAVPQTPQSISSEGAARSTRSYSSDQWRRLNDELEVTPPPSASFQMSSTRQRSERSSHLHSPNHSGPRLSAPGPTNLRAQGNPAGERRPLSLPPTEHSSSTPGLRDSLWASWRRNSSSLAPAAAIPYRQAPSGSSASRLPLASTQASPPPFPPSPSHGQDPYKDSQSRQYRRRLAFPASPRPVSNLVGSWPSSPLADGMAIGASFRNATDRRGSSRPDLVQGAELLPGYEEPRSSFPVTSGNPTGRPRHELDEPALNRLNSVRANLDDLYEKRDELIWSYWALQEKINQLRARETEILYGTDVDEQTGGEGL